MDASEDTELSTQTVTFSLVAYAQLALAESDVRRAAMALGAADGLRQRAGLRAWPSMRRGEAELATRVAQEIDPEVFEDAFAAGSELNQAGSGRPRARRLNDGGCAVVPTCSGTFVRRYPSGANRATVFPSGSRRYAKRCPQKASQGSALLSNPASTTRA